VNDDEERELRIELMKTQIDKGRLDMKRIEQEMRWEPWRAFAAFATGVAAVSGIILAVAHLLHP
jgi:hypothetical protein